MQRINRNMLDLTGYVNVWREQVFTATAGQTDFKLSTGITYPVNRNMINVFLNGDLQRKGLDYTEFDNTMIKTTEGLRAGDVVHLRFQVPYSEVLTTWPEIKIEEAKKVANVMRQQTFTVTEGQTLFSLNEQYSPGTYTLNVFLNGIKQRVGIDYLETDNGKVTFTVGLKGTDRLEMNWLAPSGQFLLGTVKIEDAPDESVPIKKISGLTKKLLEQKYYINVKEFGLMGDGVTDDSSALKLLMKTISELPNMGVKPVVHFPSGVYIVTNGVLSGFISTKIIAGVTFQGENAYSSVIYLKEEANEAFIYDNKTASKLQNVLFDKLGFTSSNKLYGNGFKITSSGNEKQFSFRNCVFGSVLNSRVNKDIITGGLSGVMSLEGTANADLMKFVDCKFYSESYVINNNNPQAVAVELHGCDGVINGDLFRFGKTPGGSQKVYGGAFDMYPNATDKPSYLVNCDSEGSHGVGNFDIQFYGSRVEFHGLNKGIVKSTALARSITTVVFQGCNLAGSVDYAQTMVSISARKTVVFKNSALSEKSLFEIVGTLAESASPEHSGLIVIDTCKVGGSASTPLFERFTIGEQGRVIAKGNTTLGSKGPGQVDVMDFDLGWQTALPRDPGVSTKTAVIIPSNVNFPFTTTKDTMWKVKIPKGAFIKRIYISKPQQGTSVSNYQLFVGTADKTIVYGSSTLSSQKNNHVIDVSPNTTLSSTTEIALWVDQTNAGGEGNHKGLGFIEYI